MNNIFKIAKVLTLALVLSVGMSYALAWTAPTSLPPAGNVSAPLNTSATAQTKIGGLNITNGSITIKSDPAYSLSALGLSGRDISTTNDEALYLNWPNTSGNVAIGGQGEAKTLTVIGTISANGGYIGNGPIPLTPHYVTRSEDTYGAQGGYYQYCNGFYNHDTCNGDYNNPFTCPKSANIVSCLDAVPAPMPRTDFGWCGSYFRDRTVSCKTNEVLSTYDDNI